MIKFEIKVNNLILLILDWCEKKKLRCVQNGLSVYFDLENLIFEDVKNELKEYLIKESGIKKIKKINIRLTDTDYNKLVNLSKQTEITVSQIVRHSIKEFLNKIENK